MNEELILNVETNNPYVIGAVAYVEQLENGAKITIVDKNGTTTATVYDGVDGKSISSITLNDDYTLTILYTDGDSTTTSSIRGATGASGVYVGDEEPENPDVDVWIDTDGEPYPIEDVIEDEVDAWLEAHPEATTTVQDGAITVPKFAAGVVDTGLNKVGYPADSKATGDAITADRTRLTAVEGEADALDARITNLAQLTDGSTTGDAELIDARVVGSTTYSTLHQAIDTEFSNVKSDLSPTLGQFDTKKSVTFALSSGSGHSSNDDRIVINIKAGTQFTYRLDLSNSAIMTCSFYMKFADGTTNSETCKTGADYTFIALKDVYDVGVYLGPPGANITAEFSISYGGIADTDIGHLQEDLSKANTGIETIRKYSRWGRGLFSNGSVSTSYTAYRLISLDIIQFSKATTLYIASGRRALFYFYDENDQYVGYKDWQTEKYVIPANQKFKIMISGTSVTDDSEYSLRPTIDEFTNYVTLKTDVGEKTAEVDAIIAEAGCKKTTTFALNVGNDHPSNKDRIQISIPTGYKYSLYTNLSTDEKLVTAYYALYEGQTSTVNVESDYSGTRIILTANSNIESVGVYIPAPSANATVTFEVEILGSAEKLIISDDLFNANYHVAPADYLTDVQRYSALFNGTDAVEPFLFFTDPHLIESTGWENKFRNFLSQIQKMYNSVPVSFCLCGGDWLGNSDSVNSACFKLGYTMATCRAMFATFYWLVGNHDTNYQGVERLSDETVNNLMYPFGKSYFEFNGKNTHFYAFDTGIEYQSLAEQNNYGWEQLTWFANELLTDNSEHIAITAHILYPSSNDSALQPLTEKVLEVAETYNNREAITLENGITYNYANATGKIEFGVFGHLHADGNAVINGIPCVMTTQVRASRTEATFDLMLVDYDAGKLYCIRVGDGSDRTISL